MEIHISQESDERTTPVKFLKELLAQFATTAEDLYAHWEEYPFVYKERQLNALLFPALINLEAKVFPEFPFKKKNKISQRFLDYYVEHKKNIYLIELKHAWQSHRSGIETTSHTDNEWLTAITQIKDLKKEVVTNQIVNNHAFDEYGIYKMALMVMPVYSTRTDIVQEPFIYANELHDEFNRFAAQKNKPNFIGVWAIDEYTTKAQQYTNRDNLEYYPYLAFVAKVEKI